MVACTLQFHLLSQARNAVVYLVAIYWATRRVNLVLGRLMQSRSCVRNRGPTSRRNPIGILSFRQVATKKESDASPPAWLRYCRHKSILFPVGDVVRRLVREKDHFAIPALRKNSPLIGRGKTQRHSLANIKILLVFRNFESVKL